MQKEALVTLVSYLAVLNYGLYVFVVFIGSHGAHQINSAVSQFPRPAAVYYDTAQIRPINLVGKKMQVLLKKVCE